MHTLSGVVMLGWCLSGTLIGLQMLPCATAAALSAGSSLTVSPKHSDHHVPHQRNEFKEKTPLELSQDADALSQNDAERCRNLQHLLGESSVDTAVQKFKQLFFGCKEPARLKRHRRHEKRHSAGNQRGGRAENADEERRAKAPSSCPGCGQNKPDASPVAPWQENARRTEVISRVKETLQSIDRALRHKNVSADMMLQFRKSPAYQEWLDQLERQQQALIDQLDGVEPLTTTKYLDCKNSDENTKMKECIWSHDYAVAKKIVRTMMVLCGLGGKQAPEAAYNIEASFKFGLLNGAAGVGDVLHAISLNQTVLRPANNSCIKIDLLPIMRKLVVGGEYRMTVAIELADASIPAELSKVEELSMYLEVASAIESDTSRVKREKRNAACSPMTGCCREEMMVNFAEVGYQFVVYPEKYNYGICKGHCPLNSFMRYPLNISPHNGTYGTHGPCCSPSSMLPLRIFYYDHNGLQEKILPNMIIKECSCSTLQSN